MRKEQYTAREIAGAIEARGERLFEMYAAGRPPNWSCDKRTSELVTIGNWLDEEMRSLGLDDLGRITQTWQFNRRSRSEPDLLNIAVEIMNDVLVDRIERDRVPHRRWG